jgi:hypothetical protein
MFDELVVEYDTELVFVPNSAHPGRIFTVFYASKNEDLKALYLALSHVLGTPAKMRYAAKRVLAHLNHMPLPGQAPASQLLLTKAHQNFLDTLASQQAVVKAEDWDEANKNERLTNLIQCAHSAFIALPLGLPREAMDEYFRLYVLQAMTDDSREELQAARLLAEFEEKNWAHQALLEDVKPRAEEAIAMTEALTQEQLQSLRQLRELIADVLSEQATQGPIERNTPAFAAAVLLARIQHDLEGARVLVEARRPHQAMTLVAALYEMVFLIGYIGKSRERATKWLCLPPDQSLDSVKKLVAGAIYSLLPDMSGLERQAEMDSLYQMYRQLCRFKHGSAEVVQDGAGHYQQDGQFTFYLENSGAHFETWLLFAAVNNANILTAHALDFYQKAHGLQEAHSERLDELLAQIINTRQKEALLSAALGIPALTAQLEQDTKAAQ